MNKLGGTKKVSLHGLYEISELEEVSKKRKLNKALGPDGFSNGIFRFIWILAVKECIKQGRLSASHLKG